MKAIGWPSELAPSGRASAIRSKIPVLLKGLFFAATEGKQPQRGSALRPYRGPVLFVFGCCYPNSSQPARPVSILSQWWHLY